MLPGRDGIDVSGDPHRVGGADRHADRQGATPSTWSSGWSPGPTTTSPSRSSPRSWWRASARGCAAARSPTPENLQHRRPAPSTSPAHQVTRDGAPIALTPLEFDLLVALARKPRQVFTREVLLEQVWGYRHAADTRLVNVHVQRLRAKIELDPEKPEIVLTVRGVGYKAGSADEPAAD